jgi:hypothetical protein
MAEATPTQIGDSRTWYLSVLERFGYPTFVTLVLGYAMYCGASWTGENVAKPLVSGHLRFMEEMTTLSRKQTENMTEVLKTQETLMHQQAELTAANKEIVKSLEALAKKIEKP